jgi:predicted membrane chloride channel (bestrophin family)
MEGDAEFREQRESQNLLLEHLLTLLNETNEALNHSVEETPTAARLDELERLRGQLQEAFRSYLDQNAAFIRELRDQADRIEEAKQKAAMAKKEPRAERDQAKIQELSEQLATDLRLERVDNAIKELLDFLSDAEFFTANASTGRRRRLRSLQNAIEKALQK